MATMVDVEAERELFVVGGPWSMAHPMVHGRFMVHAPCSVHGPGRGCHDVEAER